MDLDPNWFYSTLAQSTAAIVGLVGAFLIQRVLAVRSEVARDRATLYEQADKLWDEVLRTRTAIDHANSELRENYLEPVREGLEDANRYGTGPWSAELLGAGVYTSTSTPMPTELRDPHPHISIKPIAESLFPEMENASTALLRNRDRLPANRSEMCKVLRKDGEIAPHLPLSDEDRKAIAALTSGSLGIQELAPAQGPLARRAVDGAGGRSRSLAEGLRRMDAQIGLRSFVVLLGILFFLMICGVVAPLFFLTDRPDVDRGFLLVPFVVGSVGLLIYYGFELWRLHTADDLRRRHL